MLTVTNIMTIQDYEVIFIKFSAVEI